ncbi:MAG: hypothetical protein AAFV71_20070 [Cyanobacteria bacterium J06633_8]
MRKNNHLSSKSAACFLVAMVAFLNASYSTKVSHGNSLVIPAAVAISNKNAPPLKIGVLPTRVIWESAPTLLSLIVVSKKISKDSIKQLKTSFLDIPEGIENIFGDIQKLNYSIPESNTTIIFILPLLPLLTKAIDYLFNWKSLGGQSAGYTFIDYYDYTPIYELPAKLNLKSGYIK